MSAEVVRLTRRNPDRPQERGDRRRDALLAALEAALTRRPLAEVTVAEVASTAELARSAFYFYFPSKQAAVFSLLGDLFSGQTERVSALLSQSGPQPDNVAAALADTIHVWRTHRDLMVAALDARNTDPDAARAWEAWIQGYVDFITDIITAERTAGRAPAGGPEPDHLAHALIAMNERMLEAHVRSDSSEEDALELHRTVVHIWIAAIFGTPFEET